MHGKEKKERLVQWEKRYEIGLGFFTVILAAILIGIVLTIYRNGTASSNLSADGVYLQPIYSRKIVAGYLRRLLPCFLLWAIAVMIGLLLRLRRPLGKEFIPVSPEEKYERLMRQMMRQSEKTCLSQETIRKEKQKQYGVNFICAFICVLCLGVAGRYLLNRGHFTSWELEQVMGEMLRAVLPPLVVMFAALCARSEWRKRSLARMIPLLRELTAANGKTDPSQKKESADRKAELSQDRESATQNTKSHVRFSRLTASRLVIAAVAIVFLVIGVNNGGMQDVLVKAINICTECIGLG